MESVFRFYIRTILRATSMMITDTDNDQLNYWKFSGSGGIRTHDLRVTSPLLYQLRYRALGAVREWIPIYMAHVIPVTSCKLTILPGWNQCFDTYARYHMCHVNRDSLTHCSQGSVAQLVEQRTSNPKVVGSNPTWATEFSIIQLVIISVGYHHWCCPEDGSNIESKHWFHPGEIVSLHDVTNITCAM